MNKPQHDEHLHLSTCNTCIRILNELNLPEGTKLQDVKHEPINQAQLETLYGLTQSYEQLINKRSRVLQALNKGKALDEMGYKELLETNLAVSNVILHWEKTFYLAAKKTVQQCNRPFMDKRFLAMLAALGGTPFGAQPHNRQRCHAHLCTGIWLYHDSSDRGHSTFLDSESVFAQTAHCLCGFQVFFALLFGYGHQCACLFKGLEYSPLTVP